MGGAALVSSVFGVGLFMVCLMVLRGDNGRLKCC